MSRSGYVDDYDGDNWDLIRYRGQLASAIRGKRGQKFLTDLLAALDAMPEKRLIRDELQNADGEFCTIGVLGAARGIDMKKIYPEEYEVVASVFGIAEQLAREIVYMNDDWFDRETPEQRWIKMREWVSKQIKAAA